MSIKTLLTIIVDTEDFSVLVKPLTHKSVLKIEEVLRCQVTWMVENTGAEVDREGWFSLSLSLSGSPTSLEGSQSQCKNNKFHCYLNV